MKSPLIPARDLQPGQQFEHHGNRYIRATEDEVQKHPARELQRSMADIVLVYMLGKHKRTPASFVPGEEVKPR